MADMTIAIIETTITEEEEGEGARNMPASAI